MPIDLNRFIATFFDEAKEHLETIEEQAMALGSGQDDAETNLDKMLKSKDKMQSGGVPKLSSRNTRVFVGDPLTPANAAGSVAVRQIGRVSPDGAP